MSVPRAAELIPEVASPPGVRSRNTAESGPSSRAIFCAEYDMAAEAMCSVVW